MLVIYYTTTKNIFQSDNFLIIVRVLTWRAWRRVELPIEIAKMSWIRILDTPSCYERAAPSRGRRESPLRTVKARSLLGKIIIIDTCMVTYCCVRPQVIR